MLNPLISVVIPVKNGDAWLDKVIPAILNQTLADKTEILIIDSGSTDNTLSILANYPVKILKIAASEFNHGTTRNFGVQQAKGEFVVMTVQDAEPTDNQWLEHLMDGFDDSKVAGVCGQQVVTPDLTQNPIAWSRFIDPPSKRKVFFESSDDFLSLPPSERRALSSWDNVNAMYRKNILLKYPFRNISFAEDALWAQDILEAGYSIVYNTHAKVKHYHHISPDFTFKRSFTEYYHKYKIFGIIPTLPEPEIIALLRDVKLLLKEHHVDFMEKISWLRFNLNNRKTEKASVKHFINSLSKGKDELDRQHNLVCKDVPQAIKPSSKLNDR